jgi:MSHA pilin protein MshB
VHQLTHQPNHQITRLPRRCCRGFTLIELVVVMVVLGLLAAVAIPRFVEMRQDAHKAAVTNLVAQFQSGITLANQACIARGWAGQDNLNIFGSGNVDFNATCFPSDTSGSNVAAANAARCMRIFQGILTTSYTIATTATANIRAQVSGGRCRYTYRLDSVTRRFDYTTTTGEISNVVNP